MTKTIIFAIVYVADNLLVHPSDHPYLPQFHKDCLLAPTAFQLFLNMLTKNSYSGLFCVSFPDTGLLWPGCPIEEPFGFLPVKDTCAALEFCLFAFAVILSSLSDQVRSV